MTTDAARHLRLVVLAAADQAQQKRRSLRSRLAAPRYDDYWAS